MNRSPCVTVLLLLCHTFLVICFTVDVKDVKELSTESTVKGEMIVKDVYEKYRPFMDSDDTEECLKLMATTDNCVGRALFLQQNTMPLPSSIDDINNYCGELRSTVECVANYKKCLKLFSKTFFGIIVRDVKKTMKKICSSDVEKKTTLQHLKCFDERKLPILHRTLSSWSHLLTHVSRDIAPDNIIPNLCCSLQVIEKDGLDVINDECYNATNLNTGLFVVNLLRSAAQDAIDLGCAKFKNFSICEKELSQEMKNFTQTMIHGRSIPLQVTPIIPLLRIAKRLDEQNPRE